MVFDHVPAGCILQPVMDSESDPHLRAGEFAVTDTTDRDPQHGELYLIRWLRGGTSIVQAVSREFNNPDYGRQLGWWTRSLRRLDYDHVIAQARKALPPGGIITIPRGCMVDGPRLTDTFREALIGRVVGIYQAKRKPELNADR